MQEEGTWDAGLKHRERLFVLHYCTDDETFLNASASYRKVYTKKDKSSGKIIVLSNEVSEACSSRLMQRQHIKIAIARLLKLTQAELDETNTYRILHDLIMYSTFNPADIVNSKGKLRKNLEDLGELAKCVEDIYPTQYGLRIKLIDRSKYMTQLLKYLELVREDTSIDATIPVIEMVRKAVNPEEWNAIAAEE